VWRLTLLLGAVLLAACAGPRVTPVPGPGVTVDPASGAARVEAGGVTLAVRASAWTGTPWDLPVVVTPFHVRLVNGSAGSLGYERTGFRLFDDERYQYPALSPAEVARRYLSAVTDPVQVAVAGDEPPPVGRRRVVPAPWPGGWWGRWPWWDPYLAVPASVADVYALALPDGPLAPGARVEGFVYFPRLRREARQLTLEFAHRLGEAPGQLTLPFAVQRGAGAALPVAG
jgi:hypothetical protein